VHDRREIATEGLFADLNNKASVVINQKLYDEAITLVKNNNALIPLKKDSSLRIATIAIGATATGPFESALKSSLNCTHFFLAKNFSAEQSSSMLKKLKPYDLVIISLRNTTNQAKQNYGISQQCIALVQKISAQNMSVLSIFGNPYSLSLFADAAPTKAILIGYQDNAYAHKAMARAILGEIDCKGSLPVSGSAFFPLHCGIRTGLQGLSAPAQEKKSFDAAQRRIDSIVNEGVEKGAFPGCQITVLYKGEAVIHKAYGTHSQDKRQVVSLNDVYDLASLTKILASTLAIMRLQEQKKMDIDQTLGYYLKVLRGTPKERILIRDVLAHQAGFKSWIPFYRFTLLNGRPDSNYYRQTADSLFPFKVAENLFSIHSVRDSIIRSIIDTPLNKSKNYLYSDLGYYLLLVIIEQQSGKTLDCFVEEEFFKPMGLSRTFFNPLRNLLKSSIVPTENDTIFRRQLIQGYVHDQGAAMMGGVGGHAGLFSNSMEVALIMQMLLDKGVYKGARYFKEETVLEFTRRQFPLNNNRRGLGFDKPLAGHQKIGPACSYASDKSFGHSGFTGTYAWADPEFDLVYVFLSNRIHPDAENKKLLQLETRSRIHAVLYEELTGRR
jgi:CubicO group peptidase (beta-lactamase class C family)